MREKDERAAHAARSIGTMLPKLIAFVVAIKVIRAVVGKGHRHGGPSRWIDRRRKAIAELHRELHREDAA